MRCAVQDVGCRSPAKPPVIHSETHMGGLQKAGPLGGDQKRKPGSIFFDEKFRHIVLGANQSIELAEPDRRRGEVGGKRNLGHGQSAQGGPEVIAHAVNAGISAKWQHKADSSKISQSQKLRHKTRSQRIIRGEDLRLLPVAPQKLDLFAAGK